MGWFWLVFLAGAAFQAARWAWFPTFRMTPKYLTKRGETL